MNWKAPVLPKRGADYSLNSAPIPSRGAVAHSRKKSERFSPGFAESAHQLTEDQHQQKLIWKVREEGVAASRFPESRMHGPVGRTLRFPLNRSAIICATCISCSSDTNTNTLFGHIGEGCLHPRISFDLGTGEGVGNIARLCEDASVVSRFGGSLSGEHGDGQARGELLPNMYGPEIMQAIREFKTIWDPEWKMNPGKVVDPYPMDSNLRVGPDYKPSPSAPSFNFLETRAASRPRPSAASGSESAVAWRRDHVP